jgi:hypothetical protein
MASGVCTPSGWVSFDEDVLQRVSGRPGPPIAVGEIGSPVQVFDQ